MWEESPFQLSGGGSRIIETAGVDYILPYWMARYYGVIPPMAVQSAAAPNAAVTPESIASIYGTNLAATTQPANIQPPPTSLGGVTLTVTDSAGTALVAPLMYVSPSQINFVVPLRLGTPGPARTCDCEWKHFVDHRGDDTVRGSHSIQHEWRWPRIGGCRRDPDAERLTSSITGRCFSVHGIGMRCDSDQAQRERTTVYLILYGTGIRNRSSLTNVAANIGGSADVPVLYAGLRVEATPDWTR